MGRGFEWGQGALGLGANLPYSPGTQRTGLRHSRIGFRGAKGDHILFANLEKTLEVFDKLVQIVAIAYPVVHVISVATAIHFTGSGPIWALGFGAAVLLPKRQRGWLDQP